MNSILAFTLRVLRKLYAEIYGEYHSLPLHRENSPDEASKIIYNLLSDKKPCMIARFGANELNATINYLSIISNHHSLIRYIKGEQFEWWWNKNIMYCMQNNAGFFPSTPQNMHRFGELMIEDIKEIDLLGSWLNNERLIYEYINKAKVVHLRTLEPFWVQNTPWTKALEGKKVLVIHPFAQLIYKQYTEKRTLLFNNPAILPSFNLQTIQAVQSLGGENKNFKDWFDALHYMQKEIDQKDYDICLIGCGAYGLPLAAHVKRRGKKAIHLGGALQLLFGIKGKRWENPNYGVKEWGIPYGSYLKLMNQYWVRPGDNERPRNADKVEEACYW